MVNLKLSITLFLVFSLASFICIAQDCISNVNVQVIKGDTRGVGKVIFTLSDNSGKIDDKYFIFDVTAIDNASKKVSNKNNSVTNGEIELPTGVYEFLIISKQKHQCYKEVTVKIDEQ
jgi:hypothetical protein